MIDKCPAEFDVDSLREDTAASFIVLCALRGLRARLTEFLLSSSGFVLLNVLYREYLASCRLLQCNIATKRILMYEEFRLLFIGTMPALPGHSIGKLTFPVVPTALCFVGCPCRK